MKDKSCITILALAIFLILQPLLYIPRRDQNIIPSFISAHLAEIKLNYVNFYTEKLLLKPWIIAQLKNKGYMIENQEKYEPSELYLNLAVENLQITEISPSVIETREQTYPVTLTLVGKGFSQVNEISFCWRGFDTCYNLGGPRVWKKGDKNWVNSLKIESASS
jgi:hypothetical protein